MPTSMSLFACSGSKTGSLRVSGFPGELDEPDFDGEPD